MSNAQRSTIRIIRKESFLLAGFVFLGLIVLPIAVYLVGQAIFGDYGGRGFGQFYMDLSSRLRSGDKAALFLVFSPYLGWQTLRLMGLGWRLTRRPKAGTH